MTLYFLLNEYYLELDSWCHKKTVLIDVSSVEAKEIVRLTGASFCCVTCNNPQHTFIYTHPSLSRPNPEPRGSYVMSRK